MGKRGLRKAKKKPRRRKKVFGDDIQGIKTAEEGHRHMGFRGSVSRSSNLLVSDLVALIDALGADKVFVVGHDWGAIVAWQMCMFRPDRVRALQNLSVAYRGRNPDFLPIDTLKAGYGEDYYICRFQAPGEIEEVSYENFSILVVGASFLNQGVMVQRILYLPFS